MRYKRRRIATNTDQAYDRIFKTKGVRNITQYTTPNTPRPTEKDLSSIQYYDYVWSTGDRFWKLAHTVYNNKNLWYVIARFNNTPTEADVEPGQVIRIPKDGLLAKKILGV